MFTLKEVLKATAGKLISGKKDLSFKGISTDSRTIKKGSLFIPLIGKNYDGHNFIQEAFKRGAVGTLTSKSQIPNSKFQTNYKLQITNYKKDKVIIKVKDTLNALHNIASSHRKKFKIPIIGVTGSSGKTTTKEMVASVLSQEFKTLKTDENYNNEIGVPLTLLKLDKTYKAGVFEMAMQKLGEIDELARIVLPNIAVITNIGEAHMEHLKSKDNIAKVKSEILNYLKREDFAILPADDKYFGWLKRKAKPAKVISFGIKNVADIRATNVRTGNLRIKFSVPSIGRITLPIPGIHNVHNALAAIAVAKIFKLKNSSIIRGLKKFKPSSKRMEITVRSDGIRIINDTYNANPSSIKAALEVLANQGPVVNLTPPRKIAVLGDMLELGHIAISAHKEIGKYVAKSGIEILITVGKLSKYISKEALKHGLRDVLHYSSKINVIKNLRKFLRPNDVVLFKGSRGMKMEEIVDSIRKQG